MRFLLLCFLCFHCYCMCLLMCVCRILIEITYLLTYLFIKGLHALARHVTVTTVYLLLGQFHKARLSYHFGTEFLLTFRWFSYLG